MILLFFLPMQGMNQFKAVFLGEQEGLKRMENCGSVPPIRKNVSG
jgi:hypothetical protein